MEHVRDFGSGDQLTTEVIASAIRAIRELQRRAVLSVRPPLWQNGNTLGATIPGDDWFFAAHRRG